MSVVNLWHGAVTDTGFRARAKINGASARLVLGLTEDLASPLQTTAPAAASPLGIVDFTLSGLSAGTEYFYALDVAGTRDTARPGRIRTLPAAGSQASFTFAASSCAGQYLPGSVSDHEVFTTIKDHDPAFFAHLGDLHYRDINTPEPSRFRDAFDAVLAQPRQDLLYRSVPLAYAWDDHDYGANDAVKDSPSRAAAVQVYRERAPHYPLHDPAGVWQTWAVGRVRFILTDMRSYADPYTAPDNPDKRLLGAEQEQWFKDTLTASTEPLICWLQPVTYLSRPGDAGGYGRFSAERDRISRFLIDGGFAERMFMVSGDWHGMGFDDGSNNHWGGFPVYHCSPLDSNPSAVANPFDLSEGSHRNRGQWGKFTISDQGSQIRVAAVGYVNNTPTISHSFIVGRPPLPDPEVSVPISATVPVLAARDAAGRQIPSWQVLYSGEIRKVRKIHVPKLNR